MSDCLELERTLDDASLISLEPFFFLRRWSVAAFVLLRFPRLSLVAERSESDIECHFSFAGDGSLDSLAGTALGVQYCVSNAGTAAGALEEVDH